MSKSPSFSVDPFPESIADPSAKGKCIRVSFMLDDAKVVIRKFKSGLRMKKNIIEEFFSNIF